MAKSDAGRVLTQEEVQEYLDYTNNQLPLPEKYDSVMKDNTNLTGTVYRFAPAEYKKELDDAAAAQAQAAEDEADRVKKARTEATKRVRDQQNAAALEVPERPVENTPPARNP